MLDASSPLLTDLYQLNMLQAYLDHGRTDTAVFELFMRKLPPRRRFLLAAGLEQTLDYLENLRFSAQEIAWLASTGRFGDNLLEYLSRFRFEGDVDAMPEGTVFFADEPILRVTAPLPQAQLVETRLINVLHFQTLIASKAARMVLAAPGKQLIDFGLRRAHGAEAGLMAARASYIAGFVGTATVLAEERFGIPTFGTMAHSFVQSYDDETSAFEDFARSRPRSLTLLIDTYDTEAAARKVVALAPRLRAQGITIGAVRLDSGDLVALSKSVRRILDDGGLAEVTDFRQRRHRRGQRRPDARRRRTDRRFRTWHQPHHVLRRPGLDCAYKLQEYGGLARRKRSAGKATLPGRKQVWRRVAPDGEMAGDIISIESDRQSGEPLLQPAMRGGRRIVPSPTLAESRARAAADLARLPKSLRALEAGEAYPVEVAGALTRLAEEVDRRVDHEAAPS